MVSEQALHWVSLLVVMLTVRAVNMIYLVPDNAVSVLVRLVVTVTYADVQHSVAQCSTYAKTSRLFPLLFSRR